QVLKWSRAEEFAEMVYGGRTKEQDGIGNVLKEVLQIVRVVGSGTKGFVGDDFRDLRAEAPQSFRQVVISTVAARKEHALAANFGSQFLRESNAIVFLGGVGDGEARSPRCFRGGWADGGDLGARDSIAQGDLEALGALLKGTHGVLAGEEDPVIFTQPAERFVQRLHIIRRRKGDHRQ